jgi:proteasome lid subunit RPN8/RPN11
LEDKSKLVIQRLELSQIHEHIKEGFPEECCGLMIGKFENNQKVKVVHYVRRAKNTFAEKEKYHRYTIDPREFITIETEAEQKGKEIVGIYHSHPNAAAMPSKFDLEHAWPTLSYLVIEIRNANPISNESFLLKQDRSEFVKETLQVV